AGVCGSIAIDSRVAPAGRPASERTHEPPPFVVLKSPLPSVAARAIEGFVGSTATALTTVAARPPFDSVHVPAELLLRKTPSVEVLAKSVDDDCESMTTSTTEAVGRPLLPAPQLAAPSVLTKIPAAVTAYTVSDVSGSIAIARTI